MAETSSGMCYSLRLHKCIRYMAMVCPSVHAAAERPTSGDGIKLRMLEGMQVSTNLRHAAELSIVIQPINHTLGTRANSREAPRRVLTPDICPQTLPRSLILTMCFTLDISISRTGLDNSDKRVWGKRVTFTLSPGGEAYDSIIVVLIVSTGGHINIRPASRRL